MKELLVLLSFISYAAFGQTVNYNDVGVIVNDNSLYSDSIATYFSNARNIPPQNIIHVTAPVTEEIDSAQFEMIRAQIESYLTTSGLADSLNYLVTTKGVPLKVGSGCVADTIPGFPCASFDSELTLILGPNSNKIGLSGPFANPVYNSTQHFSRDSSGIYLVTRLDGYSTSDVYNLIDRSGPLTGINKQSALGIIDVSNATGGDSAWFVNWFTPGFNYLVNNGWYAFFEPSVSQPTYQSNVFTYITTGPPMSNVSLNFDWVPGSFSAMSTSRTAKTFDPLANPNNEFLLADVIAEGCTAAYGHVNSIFFSNIIKPEILFDRYLDSLDTFNLAESYFMAEQNLSWQTVIIGDPKASVVVDNLAEVATSDLTDLRIYPNPASDYLSIVSGEQLLSVYVYDLNGAVIKTFDNPGQSELKLDLSDVSEGLYLVAIQTESKSYREKIVVKR